MTNVADSAASWDGPCPLCGGRAHASEGTRRGRCSLLICGRCRAFVIEKRLVDVITNARVWNFPVLRHVAFLSYATQSAAARGGVLAITTTNWIRLAIDQERLDGRPVPATEGAYAHA